MYRAQVSRGAVIVWRQSSAATVPPDVSTAAPRRALIQARGQGRAVAPIVNGTTSAEGGTARPRRGYGVQARGQGRFWTPYSTGTTDQPPAPAPSPAVEEFTGGWFPREQVKSKRQLREERIAFGVLQPDPVVTRPAPNPTTDKSAFDAVIPAPRPRVDVVAAAAAWADGFAKRNGLRLSPQAYGELIQVAASAVPDMTPEDLDSPDAAISYAMRVQAYASYIRRQEEEEMLLLN